MQLLPHYDTPIPRIHFETMAHIPWHKIRKNQKVVLEIKNAGLTPATVATKTEDRVILKTDVEENAVFAKATFGYTWKLWYTSPSQKERTKDTWRSP